MKSLLRVFMQISLAIALTGCVSSSPTHYWDNAEEFKAYAEHVFQRQNHISSEILMLTEDDINAYVYANLVHAEQDLQEACELLNEYAIRKRDGESVSLLFKQQVKSSVEDCEQAMQGAEQLLDESLIGEY